MECAQALGASSVRTRSKTRRSEASEQRALVRGASMWRDTPIWLPVVWGGRIIGEVRGDPERNRTLIWCGQGRAYNDYDDAVRRKSSGKHYALHWMKPLSTSSVIDSWYDLWGTEGVPQAGTWSGTALTARQFTGSTTGAMYHGGNVTPNLKYLTRASGYGLATTQSLLLYDRVLAYDNCTMTAGSQAMTNTLPATRYISTGDPGLQIFIEGVTVHNATAANLTVCTYVDQSGNTGHIVPTSPVLQKILSVAAPTTALGSRCVITSGGNSIKSMNPYLNLASGDQGVRSITDFTWSAAPTGTNSFVLQFPLALFTDMAIAGQPGDQEYLFGLDAINKRIYDDACLCWMYNPHVATQTYNYGWMEFGW